MINEAKRFQLNKYNSLTYSVAKPTLSTKAIFENAVRDTSNIKLKPMTGTKHMMMVIAIKIAPKRLETILLKMPKSASAGLSIIKRKMNAATNPTATLVQLNVKRTSSTVRYCSQ